MAKAPLASHSGLMLTLWSRFHHSIHFKDEETEDQKGGIVWPSSHSDWQNQRVNFAFADTQSNGLNLSTQCTHTRTLGFTSLILGKKEQTNKQTYLIVLKVRAKHLWGHLYIWFLLWNHQLWRSQSQWIPWAWEFLKSHWFTSLFLSHWNMPVLERGAFMGR